MQKIVVADIFGRTTSLETLSHSLDQRATIIDPYSGTRLDFEDETEAYDYFMDNVGLDEYGESLISKLRPISLPVELIAFSVGASAVWKISDRLSPEVVECAICFYGSQIRHYQHIQPCIDVELVLPVSEPHFDVDQLSQNMAKKLNVRIHQTTHLHGFMNCLSKNFDQRGYWYYLDWLRKRRFGPQDN